MTVGLTRDAWLSTVAVPHLWSCPGASPETPLRRWVTTHPHPRPRGVLVRARVSCEACGASADAERVENPE